MLPEMEQFPIRKTADLLTPGPGKKGGQRYKWAAVASSPNAGNVPETLILHQAHAPFPSPSYTTVSCVIPSTGVNNSDETNKTQIKSEQKQKMSLWQLCQDGGQHGFGL